MRDSLAEGREDLLSLLRRVLLGKAAACGGRLLNTVSRLDDPRLAARYLGTWLRRLPPESIVAALRRLLDATDAKVPGSDFALQAILSREMRESWDKSLSRQVQALARQEGDFDLAAMLLDLPDMDPRFDPVSAGLPKDLKDIPLGMRKSMARRSDIFLLERLLSDPDPAVIANILDNPRLTLKEVIGLASRTEIREDVLERIALHPRWITQYRIKLTLAYNPSTPVRIALGLLRLLMSQDLEALGCDGRISVVVSKRAREVLELKRAKRREG